MTEETKHGMLEIENAARVASGARTKWKWKWKRLAPTADFLVLLPLRLSRRRTLRASHRKGPRARANGHENSSPPSAMLCNAEATGFSDSSVGGSAFASRAASAKVAERGEAQRADAVTGRLHTEPHRAIFADGNLRQETYSHSHSYENPSLVFALGVMRVRTECAARSGAEPSGCVCMCVRADVVTASGRQRVLALVIKVMETALVLVPAAGTC